MAAADAAGCLEGLLATVRWLPDQRDMADDVYERLLASCEQQLGPDHLHAARVLHAWSLHLEDDDEQGAHERFKRALQIRERALPPDHPDWLATLHELNAMLSEQGDYAAVRAIYERALAACEQQLGPAHDQTIHTRQRLATLPTTTTSRRPAYSVVGGAGAWEGVV